MAGGNNAIGSGAIVLTATADGLTSGLAKAGADVKAWGHSTSSNLKASLGNSLDGAGGGGFAAFVRKIGAGFGAIGQAVAGAIAFVPGIVEGAGEAAFDRLKDLAATNKAADVLGVSASSFAGMQKVLERVGVEGSDVTTMFAKMGKNILTSSSAAQQFSAMGIDAKELAGQNLAEQFKTIAEGFTKIPRGAQQAAAALDIFGKSGAVLLPVLQKGKEGINELIQSEGFEILSDRQYAAAGKAVKAWKQAKKDIEGAWEGLTNRLAVTTAPIVTMVSGTITKIADKLAPVLDWLSRGIERYGVIVQVTWEMFGEGVSAAIDMVGKFAESLGVMAGDFPTIEETISTVFETMAEIGGGAFDVLKIGAGFVAQGIGSITKGVADLIDGFHDVAEMMKKLPNELRPAGLDAFLTKVDDIAGKTRGVGDDLKKWGTDAANTEIGSTYKEWKRRMDEAMKEKPPDRAKLDAPEEVAKAFEPAKFAAAVTRGSKEAYSIEMRAKYGEFQKPENDVNKENGKKLDNIAKILNGIDKKFETLGGRIDEELA